LFTYIHICIYIYIYVYINICLPVHSVKILWISYTYLTFVDGWPVGIEGFELGWVDGCPLGEVGLLVGCIDGCIDGCILGCDDGCLVGWPLINIMNIIWWQHKS
jgi:hypothetical protein